MKRLRKCAALAVLTLTIALTGCSGSYKPEQSGLQVKKDGSVISAEVESFDNSSFPEERYLEEELKSFVEDTVIAYNKETCNQEAAYITKEVKELKIAIRELAVKGKVATLLLDCATAEDYLAFDDGGEQVRTLKIQPAPDAVAAGISLEGLKNGKGDLVDTTKAATSGKYYVVTISGETVLTVDGNIIGVSEGASIIDKKTAQISSESDVVVLFK